MIYYINIDGLEVCRAKAAEVKTYLDLVRETVEPGSELPVHMAIYSQEPDHERIVLMSWSYEYYTRYSVDPGLIPLVIRGAWTRLCNAVQREMWRRYVEEYYRRARIDSENGGILDEQTLINDGFVRSALKTHPGYVSRAETPFIDQLEVYSGAYGVGFRQHIPRYDTANYHYVRYWLYFGGDD